MITSLLLSLAIKTAHQLPGCETAKVNVVQSLGYHEQGFVPFRSPNSLAIVNVPRKDVRELIAHECGHVFDFTNNFPSNDPMFGHPPYISTYAKYAAIEDFAETYKAVVLKQPISSELQKKADFIRSHFLHE